MIEMLHLMGMVAFAVFFYRAGAMEDKAGWRWALLSVVVWLITPTFGWSILAKVLGQVLLFFGIACYRALLEEQKARWMNPNYPS